MHHSLVFFTVISQTSAGALILGYIFMTTKSIVPDREQQKRFVLTTLSLFFISLCIAFLHLGNPLNAVNALNNLKSSWLSREVLFLCCTGFSLILYLISILCKWNKFASKVTGFMAAVFSLLFICSMIRLYMLPAVKSWNNLFTPAGFILTTLTCGLALISLFGNNKQGPVRGFDASLLILCAAGIAHTFLFNLLLVNNITVLIIMRLFLSLTTIAMIVIKYLPASSNKNISLKVIVFELIIASEIMNRYIFFLSFEKSGL
jgi:DMSO reductase anchor subunit